ncbi:MAG: hypothetical protein LBC88_00750 [Spirochaetaceae bacterium]|jgi:hypothetical protein|nr:hypothetical protein [Spirochaetaceae bacterium]
MILRIAEDAFVDEAGAPITLRGHDLALEQTPEGRPFPPEAAGELFAGLWARGVNAVRLGIRHDCIEGPERGVWNEAYLAYLRQLLVRAAETGGPETRGLAAFLVPLPAPVAGDTAAGASRAGAPGGAAQREGFIAAYRHAARRLKNCRAVTAWGVMGGRWPVWIPPREADVFAAAFCARIREVYPAALFFAEQWPVPETAAARRLGLVPPPLLSGLFRPD